MRTTNWVASICAIVGLGLSGCPGGDEAGPGGADERPDGSAGDPSESGAGGRGGSSADGGSGGTAGAGGTRPEAGAGPDDPVDAGEDSGASPDPSYPSFDVIIEGTFPVAGIYAVPPLVEGGYVYWSPGDRTIRRVALEPSSEPETIYTGTDGDVSVRAVHGDYVYFGTFGLDTLPIGRVKVDGSEPQPTWVVDGLGARDSEWLVAGGRLWAGVVVQLSTGALLDDPGLDTYVEGGYCVMATEGELGLCFTTKVDFASNEYADAYEVSSAGASGLGVFAAGPHGWYVIDGDDSFTGEYRVVHVPYDDAAPEVIWRGEGGTANKSGRANADTLVMSTDDCHELQLLSLEPPYEALRSELYLAFSGPCVRVIDVDATYAYLNTALGLVRITLDELRATLEREAAQ